MSWNTSLHPTCQIYDQGLAVSFSWHLQLNMKDETEL